MPCPCCLAGLTTAPPPAHRGDWWSERCEWLFAVELTDGRDPLEIRSRKCPKHGPAATYPDMLHNVRRIVPNIYERLSPADRDEMDRRLQERQEKGKDGP